MIKNDIQGQKIRLKVMAAGHFCMLLWCMISGFSSQAQDVHFSQFHAAPLTLNPAMTGFMLGKYRFYANYRNQWGSIKSKYESYSAAFDINFMKCKWTEKNDYFAFGAQFYRDKAGELGLYSNVISFSGAYSKGFGRKNKNAIALGIQANLAQQGIDLSKAIYPDNIPESGSIANTKFQADVSAGVLYHTQIGRKVNGYIGFAAHHLNQPVHSLMHNNAERLKMRYVASAGAQVELGNRWKLLPQAMFQQQGNSWEAVAGTYVQYVLGDEYLDETAIAIGGWGRFSRPVADAFILSVRADIKNFLVGISYDFNMSELKTASQGRGAFEASLAYIGAVQCQKKSKGIICPKF
jgi:type IX secretion system PorP/SprF family membrane protein